MLSNKTSTIDDDNKEKAKTIELIFFNKTKQKTSTTKMKRLEKEKKR